MSAQSQTLLEMINDIGIKLTGKIPGTQSRPTKLEITQAINDAQDAICAEKSQYSFLAKTGKVNGWIQSAGTNSQFPKGLTDITGGTYFITSQAGPNVGTMYWAEKLTNQSSLILPTAVYTPIQGATTGNGFIDGTFNCYIVLPHTNSSTDPLSDPAITVGYPDMNNIIATATPIIGVGSYRDYTQINNICTLNYNDQNGNPVIIEQQIYLPLKFTFDGTVAIAPGQEVFIVCTFDGSSRNSASFDILSNDTQPPTDTYVGFNAMNPWTNSFCPFNIIGNNAQMATSPIGILTVGGISDYMGTTPNSKPVNLPVDCRYANRIYNAGYACYMTAFPFSAYMYRPMAQPGNTFVISGEDNNGVLQALLFPTVANILMFNIDYTAIPNKLVADGDISIIPKEFRALLKNKAIMQLVALNNGINIDTALFAADYARLLSKLNEAYLPYNEVAMSVNIGGITDNNAPSRDYQNNTNVLNEYPNSWFEAKGGTGRLGI